MNMKKNILKILATGIIATTLAAGMLVGCGSSDANSQAESTTDTTQSTDTEETQTTETQAADETSIDSGEVTTVYAATGGMPKPFTYVDESNELVGHNIELLKAAFEELPQYELVIEKTDFTSIFAGLDSDRYQIGVNNFAKNAEREEKYLFSDPIFANQYVAVVVTDRDEFGDVNALSDLAGFSTAGEAAVNTTTAIENYNKENPDDQIVINYTEEDLVLQLQGVESGKYDFLLLDKPMYDYYNKEYNFGLKELTISNEVSTSLLSEPYSYLLISKGNDQLLQDVNEALKKVYDSGKSKEINEKYFGVDYTPYAE